MLKHCLYRYAQPYAAPDTRQNIRMHCAACMTAHRRQVCVAHPLQSQAAPGKVSSPPKSPLMLLLPWSGPMLLPDDEGPLLSTLNTPSFLQVSCRAQPLDRVVGSNRSIAV